MGKMRNAYKILLGKPSDHPEDGGISRGIILKCV
jgi:hypothetical protein